MSKDQLKAMDAAATGAPLTIDIEAGRRAFLRHVGMATVGAAALAGGGFATSASAQTAPATLSDADIFNFALNLEYLEAEFYLHGAFGRGLRAGDVEGTGTQGTVTGGRKVQFGTSSYAGIAGEIAMDEEKHVKLIRSVLGSSAVAQPRIDIGAAFTAAARAAGLVSKTQTFDVYASEANFLLGAFIFEDVGVTAYHGAAPLISNKDYLLAAAGILAVEAYHAGIIRTLLFQLGYFMQAERISNLRDSVDGPQDDDQGIGSAAYPNLVPTDANALVFARTPQQVLPIVYLGGTTQGGFFPAGLNGTLR